MFTENNDTILVLSKNFSTTTIEWTPATTLPIAAFTSYIIHVYDDTGLNGVYSTNDGDMLKLYHQRT